MCLEDSCNVVQRIFFSEQIWGLKSCHALLTDGRLFCQGRRVFHCCEQSGEGKGRVGSFNFDVAEAYQINARPVNAFLQSKL